MSDNVRDLCEVGDDVCLKDIILYSINQHRFGGTPTFTLKMSRVRAGHFVGVKGVVRQITGFL